MGAASRQRPVRRAVRVKTVQHLPRPLSEKQVAALFGPLRRCRDRAVLLLMLQGGLRPGEALSLHLEDVQYGRRRVIVRYRTDHPKGARTKSRTERIIDLHEPATLEALSRYVISTRRTGVWRTPYAHTIEHLGSALGLSQVQYGVLVRAARQRGTHSGG